MKNLNFQCISYFLLVLSTLHTVATAFCEEMELNFNVNDTYEKAMFIYMHVVAVVRIFL